MKRDILIKWKTCNFSKLLEEDLPLLKKWRNEQMEVLRQKKVLTDTDQKNWFEKVKTDKTQSLFSILDSSNEIIWYCGLTNIDEEHKRWEVSFVAYTDISRTRYKEVFSDVLNALRDHWFEELWLNKIFTETYSFRTSHISILESAWFIRTGILKDHIRHDSEFYDSIIHSIINHKKDYSLKGQEVLVTGWAWIIGQELIALLKKEWAVIRCVDFAEKPKELDGIDYYRMDLSKPDNQFLFRFNPKYVFHLAADFERSTENIDFWKTNFKNNVMASHYLLEQVIEEKSLKKIVFASSYLIYNKDNYTDTGSINELTEGDPIDARNLCWIAKLQTERDIEFFNEHLNGAFDYASARIYRVYWKWSRDIVSRWIRMALRGETLQLFSKDNRFDYIHAWDVATGLLNIAKSKDAQWVINLWFWKSYTVGTVVKTIQKLIKNVKVKETNNEIQTESSQANIQKLKELTWWQPSIDLEEWIQSLIDYEKKASKGTRKYSELT